MFNAIKKLAGFESALIRIHNVVGNSTAYHEQLQKPSDADLLRNRLVVLETVQAICDEALFPELKRAERAASPTEGPES